MFYFYFFVTFTLMCTRYLIYLSCLWMKNSAINDPELVYTNFRRNLNQAYLKIFPPTDEAVMLRRMMSDMEESETQKVRRNHGMNAHVCRGTARLYLYNFALTIIVLFLFLLKLRCALFLFRNSSNWLRRRQR